MEKPKIKISTVAIDSLEYDPFNVREHDNRNVEAIKESLARFGQQKPIVVKKDGTVIAGNGTLGAMRMLGYKEVVIAETELEGEEAVAFAIADNRTAELANWDDQALAQALDQLGDELLPASGFDDDDLAKLLKDLEPNGGEAPDAQTSRADELQEKWKVERGQLWQIGKHRLFCGDSTSADDVNALVNGEILTMLHADPPYGMGKEKDGVLNDNLYAEKLDSFQMDWWRIWRAKTADNGSAYIWGNAPDLWRLWYQGGLADSERLTMRNEIVWDKGAGGFGVGTKAQRCFFPNSERCLFFMLGEQGFNNNSDNYWEGWDSILNALKSDCEKMGWGSADIKRICGVGMYGHWFTKSQWTFIPEEHYKKLQAAAVAERNEHDAFKREHDELKREHDELKREFYATRAHFDNAHENMTDVWHFPRVHGEDRHSHATPKPVEMVARALKSSSQKGDVVGAPFGGSGSDFAAAEAVGRRCFGMEIEPKYCAVILERMSDMGLTPKLAS